MHLDIKPQSQDIGAGLKGLRASGDKHVAVEGEGFEVVDQLAEFGTPAQDAELRVRIL